MPPEKKFWCAVLGASPTAETTNWIEFEIEGFRLGLLHDEDAPSPASSTAIPVFETSDSEIDACIERAESAGGSIVVQGLSNRIIMASPSGHRFEFSIRAGPGSDA